MAAQPLLNRKASFEERACIRHEPTHLEVKDMKVLEHKVVAAAMHQQQVFMADGDC